MDANELSIALVDAIAAMEASGPAVAKALSEGLAQINFTPEVNSPVMVHVEPTPVTVQQPQINLSPVFKVPAQTQPQWSALKIVFAHQQIGADIVIVSAEVTRSA